ncbi:MAG TPA: ScpA family protein [Candidatus Saccharimonadia bacterium]|nr:ScpA family protein [Candidatus Saccharimonadia bacterium]
MSLAVSVGEFEGPLGILLELVERNQMPVTEISVAAITAQYLERIRSLEQQGAEQLSEFLQLGARLLYIKSLALLPRESAQEQADELQQLNLELEEYQRYQQAARQLGRLSAGASWTRPTVTRLEPHELPLPQLTLPQLAEAFARALRQAEPQPKRQLLATPVSQAAIMARLRRRLAEGPFELQSLLDATRHRLEIIVTFLAMLELTRAGELQVTQGGQFAPIMVEPAHD